MATSVELTLLSAATATGDPVDWPGGAGEFAVEASAWNGASVALHKKGPNGTYSLLSGELTLTANGFVGFMAAAGLIKAVITGSPTGVYATAKGLG